jgi:hypothetical protein
MAEEAVELAQMREPPRGFALAVSLGARAGRLLGRHRAADGSGDAPLDRRLADAGRAVAGRLALVARVEGRSPEPDATGRAAASAAAP